MTKYLFVGFLLLAACGDYCDLERVAECPDCGPGEVRHAFVLRGAGGVSIDRTSDGTVCLTCDSILFFETRQRSAIDVGSMSLVSSIAAGGDTIYVVQRHSDEKVDELDEPPRSHTLLALAADGRERWRKDLGESSHFGSWSLIAGPEGPYVLRMDPLRSAREIVAVDADGNVRWRDGYSERDVIVPDGTGGTFTAIGGSWGDPPTSEVTVRSRDQLGALRWSRTWKAADGAAQGGRGVYIDHAAAGTRGEIAIVGAFHGTTLDFGDRTLNSQDSISTFVALLDTDGATKWAASLGRPSGYRMRVAIAGDQVIIGGSYSDEGDGLGLPDADDVDGFVAVVDSTGLVRSTLLGGPAYQAIDDLRSGPDGTVSIMVTNAYGEHVGAQLAIGSTTFEAGKYADDSNRTYLINLLP